MLLLQLKCSEWYEANNGRNMLVQYYASCIFTCILFENRCNFENKNSRHQFCEQTLIVSVILSRVYLSRLLVITMFVSSVNNIQIWCLIILTNEDSVLQRVTVNCKKTLSNTMARYIHILIASI